MATTVTINETTEAVTVTISEGLLPGSNANQLGSGTATDGQVLTADGAGNTAWESIPAGADAWDDLTGTATKVPFNTAPSVIPTEVGSTYWNEAYETLELVQDADGNSLTVGLEIKIPVRNVSGVSITDGLAVYVAGEASSRASVALASVSDTTHIASTIGVASQTIASPGNGKVTTQGEVHNLDTSSLTAGQPIYLQENGTYNHTPSAIRIGWVLDSSNGNGKIYVSVARMKWLSADISDAVTGVTGTSNADKLIKLATATGSAPRRVTVTGTSGVTGMNSNQYYLASETSTRVYYSNGTCVLERDSNKFGGAQYFWKLRNNADTSGFYSSQSATSPDSISTWDATYGTATGTPAITVGLDTVAINQRKINGTGSISSYGIGASMLARTWYSMTRFPSGKPDPAYDAKAESETTSPDDSDFVLLGNAANAASDAATSWTRWLVWSNLRSAVWTWIQTQFASGRSIILTGTQAQARAELGSGAVGDSIFLAATIDAARQAAGEYNKIKNNTVTHTSSTAFTSDAEVTHTLDADSVYKVEGIIFFDAPSGGGGLRAAFFPPSLALAGAAGNGWGMVSRPDGTTIPVTYSVLATNGFGIYSDATARTGRPISFVFFFKTGATGGAMPLQTAQQSSSATSTLVLPGTYATYKKIG